jgi:hypothetical protein
MARGRYNGTEASPQQQQPVNNSLGAKLAGAVSIPIELESQCPGGLKLQRSLLY